MNTQAGLIDRPNGSKSYRSQCFAISGSAQVSISKQNTSGSQNASRRGLARILVSARHEFTQRDGKARCH